MIETICDVCVDNKEVVRMEVRKMERIEEILKEFCEAMRNAKTDREIAKAYDEAKEKLLDLGVDANEFGVFEDRRVTKILKVGEIDNKEIFAEIASDFSEVFRIF